MLGWVMSAVKPPLPSAEHQRLDSESEEEAQSPCRIKINMLNENKLNFCAAKQIWGVWGREKGEERVYGQEENGVFIKINK